MNQTEKRRQELLEQTRKIYRNSNSTPAIHPRYRATYTSIYGEDEEEKQTTGLGFRFFLALMLLIGFVAIDQSGEKIATVDSQWIEEKIIEDMDFEEVWQRF